MWSQIRATHGLEFILRCRVKVLRLCVVVFNVETRGVGLEQALVD
jgi:hypothetical protein